MQYNSAFRYQSETESESYTSGDQSEDEYTDGAPLIRNNNNVDDDPNDALRSPVHMPGAGGRNSASRTPPRADVVLVQHRCCGTCCAIAAVVTCAVIVVLIVYPIVYLLKHSSLHF